MFLFYAPSLYFIDTFFENQCKKVFLSGDCDYIKCLNNSNVLSKHPLKYFSLLHMTSQTSLVILPNVVGHKIKVARIYLHTQLLIAIEITVLSINRPPLKYAAIINYVQFVFVVKDLTTSVK